MGTPAANALATVSIGGNDVLNLIEDSNFATLYGTGTTIANVGTTQAGQDVAQSVSIEAGFLGSLVALGLTNVVVMNVPDIGKTPEAMDAGAAEAAAGTVLANYYNNLLSADITSLNSGGAHISIDDAFSLMDSTVADPASENLQNVTAPVYSGSATSFVAGDLVSSNTAVQDGYLFFDKLHPTETGESGLAQLAQADVTSGSAGAVTAAYLGIYRTVPTSAYVTQTAAQIDGGQTTLANYENGLIASEQAMYSTLPALVTINAFYNATPIDLGVDRDGGIDRCSIGDRGILLGAVFAQRRMFRSERLDHHGVAVGRRSEFGVLSGIQRRGLELQRGYFHGLSAGVWVRAVGGEFTEFSERRAGCAGVARGRRQRRDSAPGRRWTVWLSAVCRPVHANIAEPVCHRGEFVPGGGGEWNRQLWRATDAAVSVRHRASDHAAMAADPSVITVTTPDQLVDPGAGNFTIQFAAGAADDTLVLNANGVDQVAGFDPASDVLNVGSLVAGNGLALSGDMANLSGYLTIADQSGNAVVRFDPTGQGGGNTVAVLQGLGGVVTGLDKLHVQGAVQLA